MPKFTLLFAFLFFSIISFGQTTTRLKGKVINSETKLPIESATVYLSYVKDSTVIDYTITDRNGLFSLKTKLTDKPTLLKVSALGFSDYKKQIEKIASEIDLETVAIIEGSQMLGEIVVRSEAPPVRIKKDTLEFNVASFKVRPDSNVETLLKQLPGVEVGSDGKITVNGKEVNQILVNGKPFFDKDGKVALQNLPSEIIKKVQITDTKTKKEELTGKAASSDNASINLTIDENKNKGLFAKFMAGHGSDKRYESSGLVNYFKNKRKISVLASSNNINSTGFSMDEIFDNMGGGRNTSMYYTENGGFSLNGMRFGGGAGITHSDMVGINYSDEWAKGFETNGSYFFNNQNTKNNNRVKQINFLPAGDFTTESNSNTKTEAYVHNANLQFEYKIDSTTTLSFIPKFTKSKSKYNEVMFQSSRDENNNLLNESNSSTFNDKGSDGFTSEIVFNKSLNKRGRYLNFSLTNDNKKDEVFASNQSATIFHQGTDPDDIRNQIRNSRNLKDNYTLDFDYSEPLKDSLSVQVGMNYNWIKSSENRKAFDYDEITQSYSDVNENLTNDISSTAKTFKPNVGFNIEKKKFNFYLTTGTSLIQFDNHSFYLGSLTNLSKEFVLPFVSTTFNYKISKSKSIWLNYRYESELPSASQVLPVEDLTNPLYTTIGNPNLDLNKNHYLYFSFRNFDNATRSGYSFYFGGNYYDSQVVPSTTFGNNAKRTTTYKNVEDTYYTWSGLNWNKTIKKEANTFKFSAGTGANFSMSKGFANNEMYDAFGVRLRLRSMFTYEYGELLTINPSYNYTYNTTKYTNFSIGSASTYQHQFNIQTTNYWPKNWVFGNDFGYTYNSNIADGFKKDFYLWNTSLAYNFFDKKMTAKVKVYDVLNQNQSTIRTIAPSTIRDEENTVLKRYLMFSLTYKIERFAGKEKSSRSGRGMY